MKHLIILLIIAASFNCNAQKYNPPKGWKSTELYLPTTILISTFTINQYAPMSLSTRNKIAATGLFTSVATHFVFRKIRENRKFKKKRNFAMK